MINKIFLGFIIIYIFLRKRIQEFKFDKNNKKILIILHNSGIGDTLLILPILEALDRVIIKKSIKICVALDKETFDILNNLKCNFKFEYIFLDCQIDKRKSPKVFYNNYINLNKYEYNGIICFERIGGYFKGLIAGLNYNWFIGSEWEKNNNLSGKIKNIFLKNKKIIYFKNDEHLLNVYKGIYMELHFIGIDDVLNDLYYIKEIPVKQKYIDDDYCIISSGLGVGHAYQYRSWPPYRFAKVADYIIDKYNLKIYLCGSKDDIPSNEKIFKLIKKKDMVINLTGRTNFQEWIEIIRNAKFILGNDSGYIHLAACVKTQAFVIIGYWNYGRFHPYRFKNNQFIIPLLISSNKPKCNFCGIFPVDNKDKKLCNKLVEEKGVYNCIYDINIKNAIDIIDKYYLKGNKHNEAY